MATDEEIEKEGLRKNAREKLADFIDAAGRLSDNWDEELDEGYPEFLPEFSEFFMALIEWRDYKENQKEKDEQEDNLFVLLSSFKSFLKRDEWGIVDGPEPNANAKLVILDKAIGRFIKQRGKEWEIKEVR